MNILNRSNLLNTMSLLSLLALPALASAADETAQSLSTAIKKPTAIVTNTAVDKSTHPIPNASKDRPSKIDSAAIHLAPHPGAHFTSHQYADVTTTHYPPVGIHALAKVR